MHAAHNAPLQEEAGHLLDEQRHAACPLAHALDEVLRERVTRRKLTDHLMDLSALERSKRNGAVMRAHAPRRTKLWSRCRYEKERRLSAPLGKGAQEVERGGVGPMQVFESEHDRLRARPGQDPGDERGQLTSPKLLRRKGGLAARRKRNVYERREQWRVFDRVEADQSQCAFKIGEAMLQQEHLRQIEAGPIRKSDEVECSVGVAMRSTRPSCAAAPRVAHGTLQ